MSGHTKFGILGFLKFVPGGIFWDSDNFFLQEYSMNLEIYSCGKILGFL